MAINFTNLPVDDVLINGFNPYFITFESDVSATPTNAIITFTRVGTPNIDTFINITPNNDGLFVFNFQGIYKDVYKDYLNFGAPSFNYPDISTASDALFIDDFINTKILCQVGIYNGDTLIDSLLAPNEIEFYFLKGSSQVLNSPFAKEYSQSTENTNSFNLALMPNESTQNFNIWEGFPFDVQYDSLDSTSQFIQNGSGVLISKTLNSGSISRTSRLVLIDHLGNELNGLNDNTTNGMEIGFSGGYANNIFLKPNYKKVSCPDDAKYIRFGNSKGGSSYWLFDNNYIIQKKRSNKKRISRNFTSLENASSRYVSLGSDVSDILVVSHTTSQEYENNILRDLIGSSIIELYLGGNKWKRIDLINHNGDENGKQVSTNFNFSFDLGINYNQSV